MREFLELMLVKAGYNVDCAESGKEAVSLIDKTIYDLVLTDIRLGSLIKIREGHPL